jgi:hypothetical protein
MRMPLGDECASVCGLLLLLLPFLVQLVSAALADVTACAAAVQVHLQPVQPLRC